LSGAAASWLRRGLALTAGLAAALAHPPFGVLIGLLGYGLLMHRLDAVAADPRPLRSAFLTGWLAGVGYFAVGVWWVVEAFMVDAESQGWLAPFAIAALCGGLALFWGLAGVLYRRLAPDGPQRALVFAGVLTGCEWLRGHVLTGFPWNLPGETWAAGSAPSQAAALVGAYGLTWITLAIACGLSVVLEGRRGRNLARAAVLALVLLYGGGALRLAAPAPGAPGVNLRIVQANIAQSLKYDREAFVDIVGRYMRLTTQPSASGVAPQVVVWPEGAIPAAVNDYLAPGTWTRAAIEDALTPGQSLLIGAYRVSGDPRAPDYYNSLVAVQDGADGLAVTGVYDKFRLVPGGEFLPFDRVWAALGVKKLVNIGDGFSSGPKPRPLMLPGLPPAQPLICYESLFPGFTREGAHAAGLRPAWIVNISNDAWFGATSGPWQHLNLASYRAIEEGLPMIRATPTGVSAVIDARGRTVARLGQGQAGVIDATLPGAEATTLYSRVGEAPMVVLLIVAAAATGLFKRRNLLPDWRNRHR
jgi:apolipoprotein N-acyltransferase